MRYRRRLAPDFSPLSILRVGENEVSRLIACLLDPRGDHVDPHGDHAQGDVFLAAFLGVAGIEWTAGATVQARVTLETPDRCDIFVRSGTDAFVIENKLRCAVDQQRQVSRAFDTLDNVGASRGNVVYLTTDGGAPSDWSFPADERESERGQRLKCLGARELGEWLKRCRASCEAVPVTAFIDSFAQFAQKEFEGVRDMTEADEIRKLITEDPSRIPAFWQLTLLKESLIRYWLNNLNDDLKSKCQILGLTVYEEVVEPKTRFKSWQIGCADIDSDRLRVAFGFEINGFREFGYGVCRLPPIGREKPSASTETFINTLRDELGPAPNSQPWWPWFVCAPDSRIGAARDWLNDGNTWRMIVDGTLAESFVSTAQELIAATKQAIAVCPDGTTVAEALDPGV